MIYDRTYIDIIKAKNIFTEKIQNFIELTSDEQNTMNRAYFNLETLNRIVDKINLVWFYLQQKGITKVENEDVRQWSEQEFFKINNFSNIKKNINDVILALENLNYYKVPQFKSAYNALNNDYTYTNLNNLEKLLYDLDIATQELYKYSYVSLGDSIAAGHSINGDWQNDYGVKSQYGENGNTFTQIVPNSYTDLISKELVSRYGDRAKTESYAHSGDTVADLIKKIRANDYNNLVANSIRTAELVTISIGANDILGEVNQDILADYIEYGNPSLVKLGNNVQANLDKLNDDTNLNSYKALFNELNNLNSRAKYIFTAIYNPYKYLWLDEGKNGFFKPVLDSIPQMTILGFEVDELIKNGLLHTSAVQTLFSRVNALAPWVEKYVNSLNEILKNKINEYQTTNSNFAFADTKAVFDSFPDRPYNAEKHYNDLVNVEFTRNYDTAKMDWGKLWENSNAETFWINLATKYVSWSGFDIERFTSDLVGQIIVKVIVPDLDPHPETYGQYVMKRAFADVLGWENLDRYSIQYKQNGTSTTYQDNILGVDNLPAFVVLSDNRFTNTNEGYYFTGWNTNASGTGISYADKQPIIINSNLVLYAQWSNIYIVTYMHTNHTNLYGNDETGHKECYALWIDGQEMPKFGTFAEGSITQYRLPYGTPIGVVVSNYNPTEITYDDVTCRVYFNDAEVASGWRGTTYDFVLTRNTIIDFRWKIAGSLATFNAQSWEDCHITTN